MIIKCYMTNSTQWAENKPLLNPQGIILHSSGQNKPYLKHFIQPSKNQKKLVQLIGENTKHTDWNHTHRFHNFHYWIGKDINGNTQILQAFPLDMKVYPDKYIHVCICEDNLKNIEYLKETLNLFIWLCNNLNINNIKSYSEISNSADIEYWLEKYGYNMDWVRLAVQSDRLNLQPQLT